MISFFSKLFSIFKKMYPVYWGIEPDRIKDKAYYQEEKTYTYSIIKIGKENVLFYAYPKSFGTIRNIYVLDPSGDKKDVTSEWKYTTIKENYVYSTTIVPEQETIRTFKFTYSGAERP